MRTLKPRSLKPGGHVRIISPASPIEPAQLDNATAWLGERGYRVTLGKHVFDSDGYLAGQDADRAADLMEAFEDREIDAVLCSRGGYGCARLLPLLDLDAMAASGKLFVGFSDVTTLHNALNRRGLATLHGPMGLTFSVPREPWVYESLANAMKGIDSISKEAPKGNCIVEGAVEGTVVGGCLCLIADSIGTADALDCEGRIVLIEDVDETPHRVDAMLTHLLNAGVLQRAAGIIVGEMTRTDEKVDPSIGSKPWRDIVIDRLKPLGLPMIIDFPFGHAKNMLSLPLGIRARLDSSQGTLKYLEHLCE